MHPLNQLIRCTFLVFALVAATMFPAAVRAQIDPAVRDAVVPATVEIAVVVLTTSGGQTSRRVTPRGSGSIVAPNGLILTNQHVVDLATLLAETRQAEADMIAKGWDVRLRVIEDRFLILISDGRRPPVERFTAVVVAISRQDDLAVLRIRGDAEGRVLDLEQLVFPFVSLGDSNTVELGDPVHVFGYPGIGGGSLTYTSGVVSGFYFDEAGIEPAWIISDATIAPGNSGGTAVDAQGRLIGVPTMTRSVDRTSDDVVGDGAFDDVSAALGGSLAWLLPINVAKPLLSEIAPEFFAPADEEQVASNE